MSELLSFAISRIGLSGIKEYIVPIAINGTNENKIPSLTRKSYTLFCIFILMSRLNMNLIRYCITSSTVNIINTYFKGDN